MGDSHPHAPQVRDVDWKVWHLRPAKEPRSGDALLSFPVRDIPEDWGRVIVDWNNYEKDYKDPYDIDFNKLHDLYIQVGISEDISFRHTPRRKRKTMLFMRKL